MNNFLTKETHSFIRMKITVIGSGAMGSLFGGLLAKDGQDVTLLDIWKEHINKIKTEGLRITSPDGGEDIIKDIRATTELEEIEPPTLAILFVKSIHTKEALRDASPILNDEVDVMTLQNGLGNPEKISQFIPRENIIAGVTTHGSTLKGSGHIIHAGKGTTEIGRYYRENDERVNEVAEMLSSAGIKTSVSGQVEKLIWEKVLVNIGINIPTALARIKNKFIAESKFGNQLVERAVEEAMEIAWEEGIDVREDMVSYVLEVASNTGENKSSMLQDMEVGRKTEIENFSGAIIDMAEKHEIPCPVNRTFYNLVRLSEKGNEGE